MLKNNEPSGIARISDFVGVLPVITGKVELVYEGEQLGPYKVAFELPNKSHQNRISNTSHILKIEKNDRDPYGVIKAWIAGEHDLKMSKWCHATWIWRTPGPGIRSERLMAKAADVDESGDQCIRN